MTDIYKHEEEHVMVGGLLKEAVFGFNDGVVSTFAVVAGMTGGLADQKIVLLAALATLIAGAFSMGLGTYLGSKSETDLYHNERQREIYEMEFKPDMERHEIREIYKKRGFKGKLLEDVVNQITNNPKVWLETMMTEELGFAGKPDDPVKNGLTMSVSFVVGSAIPTIPYFLKPQILSSNPHFLFYISLVASVIGLLFAGAFKTKFTGKNKIVSAIETLLVGASAATGSFLIGLLLGQTGA